MHFKREFSGNLLGSLIDLETTGLDALGDELVTFSYIWGNTLRIIQRKCEESELVFVKRVKPILEKLPQPFYAYNTDFERDFIKTKFGIYINF